MANEQENRLNTEQIPVKPIIIGVAILIGLLIAFVLARQFFYFFQTVNEQEVGVRFKGGRIVDIVGPGVYNDIGIYLNLQRISSQAIPFPVQDDEIITKDKQRLGLIVSGDIFRPNISQKDTLRTLWAQYRGLYLDDGLARASARPGATIDESVRGRPHF